MNEMEQLIETTDKLCNTLSLMADNEKKFGWDLCYRIEQLNWEMKRTSDELRDITSYLVGGVA